MAKRSSIGLPSITDRHPANPNELFPSVRLYGFMKAKKRLLCLALSCLMVFVTFSAAAAQTQTWNLATDFRIYPNQANPNPDTQSNANVWYFMESSSLTHDPMTYSLLPEFITDAFYIPGIQQWQGTTPSGGEKNKLSAIGINATGSFQQALTISWPANVVRVHPLPDRFVVVGWRSPINGSVDVTGSFYDLDANGGDGVDWFIDRGAMTIASGAIANGGSQQFQSGVNGVSVNYGDFLYFIVGPNGSYDNDSTGLDLTIIPSNTPPTVTSTSGPSAPIALGSSATTTATFADVNTSDTHTCNIAWGDSTSNAGTVSESNGNGTCTGSHLYTATGVYDVTFTVTDNSNASGTGVYQFVVIYDPNGGFVTGGGWINSPYGAYVANPSLTGKANFGFVSKYKTGATIPTGNTEFHFNTGSLDFSSTAYQWLVIAGAKAQYKGSGTINGAGNYGFLLTATDGNINPGGVDTFRIKIWDSSNSGAIVYDNAPGSDDINASGQTALGGGDIIIHK
jgi:hypothetical protein